LNVVRTVAEMAALGGRDIGFVPTMGAFHEGHLALMRAARMHHQRVCVSLFVNPLQFGGNEDIDRYPRNEARDFELAAEEGVDLMFAPAAKEIYPRQSTTVHVSEITDKWEGKSRPGHFDGVATVVAKLFNIVSPEAAYFGWKDLQQCAVVSRLVEDLNMPLRLVFMDTVRAADGLALSSRNAYLSPDERAKAPQLYETLCRAGAAIREGADSIETVLVSARNHLAEVGFEIDYLDMVSLSNLEPIRVASNAALIVAAKLGTTRLIDNLRMSDAVT
jgi:pantoate--beta-alanine ligase